MDSDAYMSDPESVFDISDDDFCSDQENIVIPATKKTAAKPKTALAKGKKKDGVGNNRSVLTSNSSLSNVVPKASGNAGKGTKTVEEIYQKKTQLEHILLRPDTYSK